MNLYTLIRAILTTLVAIFIFMVTMFISSFVLGLNPYSLDEITNKVGGINVFLSVVLALIGAFYFLYYTIQDSFRKDMERHTLELINDLKRMSDEIIVNYGIIKDISAKVSKTDQNMREIQERIIAIEKLLVELISKFKK